MAKQYKDKEKTNDPKDLINWGEVSRRLSGTRSVITRKNTPQRHNEAVNDLLGRVKEWDDKQKKGGDE